ncbi:MAG: ATP synthase F1 subunit delta [Thermodesulfovibrio sp. RBG_19FT_COMBO_42_12]|nr:MAG: ATP synthase F1 subunit delta [Thermodesulfovibrio sp. RBG_19FT_COMBO_42_12]
MKKNIKEAKRYAIALLRNVGIENAPQAIAEVNVINDLMAKSKDFKNLLINPQFTLEEREKVIKQIADKLKLSENTIKFIAHLSELRFILLLPDLIRIATYLYLEKKQKAKAIVMTPIEISKDYENTLKSSLKKVTGRDVEIEYIMDPSLLGGILIKIGSTMYDTSIKGQLRLLKNELIKR